MSNSTNLSLNLYHHKVDKEQSFEMYRADLDGIVNSNMMTIDSFAGSAISDISEIDNSSTSYFSGMDTLLTLYAGQVISGCANVVLSSNRIVKLAEHTGSGQVDFNSISQNYTHLLIMGTTAGSVTSASSMLACDFNSDLTSGNYKGVRYVQTGYGDNITEYMAGEYIVGGIPIGSINNYLSGSSGYSTSIFAIIPNYSGSTGFYKTAMGFNSIYFFLFHTTMVALEGGTFLSTDAITRIRMFSTIGDTTRYNLLENTVISLYGVY